MTPKALEDPATFLLYVVGFFDGEGSINIIKMKRLYKGADNSYHTLFVTIAQVSREPLDLIAARWGGTVMTKHNERIKSHWRPAHHWQIANAGAEAFLQEIQPHVIIKARDIEIALRFREIKAVRGSTTGQGRGTPRQQDVHDAREVLRLELLKRRHLPTV